MYERYVLKLHLNYDAKLDREDRIKELRSLYHEERAQYTNGVEKDTEAGGYQSELPHDVLEYFHYESGGVPSSQLPTGMLGGAKTGGALH